MPTRKHGYPVLWMPSGTAVVILLSRKGTLRLDPPTICNDPSTEDITDRTSPDSDHANDHSSHCHESPPAPSPAKPTEVPSSQSGHPLAQPGGSTLLEDNLTSCIANFEMWLDTLECWPQEATLGHLEHCVQQLEDQISDYQTVIASMAQEITALQMYIPSHDKELQQANHHAMIIPNCVGVGELQDGDQDVLMLHNTPTGMTQSDHGKDIPTPATMQSKAPDIVHIAKVRSGDMDICMDGSTNDKVSIHRGEACAIQVAAMAIQSGETVDASAMILLSTRPDTMSHGNNPIPPILITMDPLFNPKVCDMLEADSDAQKASVHHSPHDRILEDSPIPAGGMDIHAASVGGSTGDGNMEDIAVSLDCTNTTIELAP
ncbi:hypothetical protein EDC04DRAFT_2608004 [Pisolithus marmoratus]|nr:hypothetical protein EDC04DRAFT_2608004 [Pisolithus marmoratus]